jgi:coenzyme F420-reducing hydrogenase delta subunit
MVNALVNVGSAKVQINLTCREVRVACASLVDPSFSIQTLRKITSPIQPSLGTDQYLDETHHFRIGSTSPLLASSTNSIPCLSSGYSVETNPT